MSTSIIFTVMYDVL